MAGFVVLLVVALQEAGASADADPKNWVHQNLVEQSLELLEERKNTVATVQGEAAIRQRQRALRRTFQRSLGDFPVRSPLNAQVVGQGVGEGYRYEKILFESRPGFVVSSLLFLPESEGPHPGILVPCGHAQDGKAFEAYQRACILLARHGMAALCFDPIGQGERKQILDEEGQGRFHATEEHMVLGVSCVLLGHNLASHFIWDGMRALDYLASRPDIDRQRLGCTGNSGGGTQTSYLMALDDRIQVAAPACYLTGFEKLLTTIGPQDAEQNLFGQIANGLDHADFVFLRAPRPTLIAAATKDFFDIEGTRSLFTEAKGLYRQLEADDQLQMIEADARHGFSQELREGVVSWFQRWLIDPSLPDVAEVEVPVLCEEESQCSEAGQVVLRENSRTMMDLHRAESAGRQGNPPASRMELRRTVLEVLSLPALATDTGDLGGKRGPGGWSGPSRDLAKARLRLSSRC